MRRKGRLVLWPAYFDADHSKRLGRRVPKIQAIRSVKAEEVFQAALELGLNPDLRGGAAHPRRPWWRGDVVIVDKRGSKTSVMKDLAQKIREKRRLK